MAKKMIRPIRTETEYDEALEEIERYFENEPKPGTPEADRFDTKKRPLTMRMAWKLHREWNIPAEALIAPPRTRGRRSAA